MCWGGGVARNGLSTARAELAMAPRMVWYGMVEVCEGAPVAVSGWVLADRHDRHNVRPCAASTRLVQPSLSIWFFLHKKKVGNFGEKPFVWEFLLGGDASKKRIKKFTRKNHHGGSPAPPRVPDLVCKISFASRAFLVAVANLISFCRI